MTLIQKRTIGTWSFVAVIALALPVSAWAASDAVTVHRGSAVTGPGPGPGGVPIEPGTAAPTVPTAYDRPQPVALHAVGGRSLWFIDTEANKLTSCVTRRSTQVGRDNIRCTTRGLPVN